MPTGSMYTARSGSGRADKTSCMASTIRAPPRSATRWASPARASIPSKRTSRLPIRWRDGRVFPSIRKSEVLDIAGSYMFKRPHAYKQLSPERMIEGRFATYSKCGRAEIVVEPRFQQRYAWCNPFWLKASDAMRPGRRSSASHFARAKSGAALARAFTAKMREPCPLSQSLVKISISSVPGRITIEVDRRK